MLALRTCQWSRRNPHISGNSVAGLAHILYAHKILIGKDKGSAPGMRAAIAKCWVVHSQLHVYGITRRRVIESLSWMDRRLL